MQQHVSIMYFLKFDGYGEDTNPRRSAVDNPHRHLESAN